MMLNAKILIIMGLVSYGVIARNMEGNKELLKEPSNKKHGVSMLMEIAKELVQRSSTSSQVCHHIIIYYKYNRELYLLCTYLISYTRCKVNKKVKATGIFDFASALEANTYTSCYTMRNYLI